MRQTIVPGAKIDVPSLREIETLLANRLRPDRRTYRDSGVVKTDGNGNGNLLGTRIPPGMEFALHRVTIDASGSTPAAPFTNANGYVLIARNDLMIDFLSFVAPGGLPAVYTAGEADAPRYSNGEAVQLIFVGGPVSQTITARFQGTLMPVTVT